MVLDFRNEYTLALTDFVVTQGHLPRRRAIQLGQQASAEGLSVSTILKVHNDAVERAQADASGSAEAFRGEEHSSHSSSTFFRESLAAYESSAAELTRGTCTMLQLNEALEMQARRIAQALHDEAGQLLTLAHLRLAKAERMASPECAVHLTEIRALFLKIEEQLRRFSHELNPAALEEFGLVDGLEFLVEGVAERTGLNVQMDGHQGLELTEFIETVVYRFVQEALTNVIRHARATAVMIVFEQTAEELTCIVTDNGTGFDLAKCRPGMGLSGMRQRIQAAAGKLSVESSPGRGAELTITIPF